MNILIIRPMPDLEITAHRVRRAGMTPVRMPLFEISPISWQASEAALFDGLFFSSANAPRRAGKMLDGYRDLPVIAVGDATAAAAKDRGLNIALTGDEGKAAILAAARDAGYRRLLWLAGGHVTARAADEDIIAQRCITYEMGELPPADDFAARMPDIDVTLLHSPRSARYFRKLIEESGVDVTSLKLAVLSPAVATAAGGGWGKLAIADKPNEDALLQAASAMLD